MMKTRSLAGIFVLLVACSSVAYSQPLVEEFSFQIKDFKMDHQTQTNNLNIFISYRYIANIKKPDYPDFRWLAKDVETLLNNYPNKDDYWEIVNKQITSLLLNKYKGITSVTCEIKVDPSSLIPYARSSRVTRYRSKRVDRVISAPPQTALPKNR
jgi:hypothetical protein